MAEIASDILSGIVVGSSHSRWFVKNWCEMNLVRPAMRLAGLGGSGGDASVAGGGEKPGLKVVGVGYGRTGTYSLTLALDELGFPCLHTQHLYESPDIFNMWAENVFTPSLEAGSALMGEPDFDLMASRGWRATTDLPMALYYRQVLAKYPDCKFVLTTRENSEVWFRSWDMLTKTITQPTSHFLWMSHVQNLDKYFRWLFAFVNKDSKYFTADYPLPDQIKENAISSYEEHNRRVREVIPEGQLLEYNVKQGWEPLCDFLEIENCPTTPFPKTNSARSVQIQAVAAMVIPLSIVLFILFYLFSCAFKRSTGQTVLQWLGEKRRLILKSLAEKEVKRKEKIELKRQGLKAD